MKMHSIISVSKTYLFFILVFFSISAISCKKSTPAPAFQTLDLQPQSANDVSVFYYKDSSGTDSAGISDRNFYGDSILYINAYTSPRGSTGANAFIKFDGLSALPANANILVAKLYLYGTDSSYVPVNFFGNTIDSGGNSNYPGLSDSIALTLYNTNADTAYDNTLLFQNVTSSWDAHTITYNTQPSVSGSLLISSSTSRWYYNIVVDVTGYVKDWQINPASNFGWKLSIANYNYSPATVYINHQMVFYSSSAQNVMLHPELIVVYE